MVNRIVFPVPWFVPASIANFGLMIAVIPFPVIYALLEARPILLQRQQDQLLTQLYLGIGIIAFGSVVAATYFFRKAFHLRRYGLDTSLMARAPRMLRFSAWLTAVSCSGLILVYGALANSVLMWLVSIYLLATIVGIAMAADFAARSTFN